MHTSKRKHRGGTSMSKVKGRSRAPARRGSRRRAEGTVNIRKSAEGVTTDNSGWTASPTTATRISRGRT